jgi:hypothetical protein
MDTCKKEGITESRNPLNFQVPPAGIEPATPGLGNQFKGFQKGLKILNYLCLAGGWRSYMVSYVYP